MNLRTRKFLNTAILSGIFIVGLIAGVVVFDRVLMPSFTTGSGTRLIPDVTGLTQEEAENIARESGFDFRVLRKEHSDSIPEGYVISQRPVPGSPAKKGRRISVVTSLSAASTPVPDVIFMHFRSAQLTIERSGLKIGQIIYQHSDTIRKETVITTSPIGVL